MATDLESAMKQWCSLRGFFVVISLKNDYRYPCYLESDKKFSLSVYAIKKNYLDIRNISFLFILLVFSSSTSFKCSFISIGDSITLYVSTNQNKQGQYRLWRQSSNGSNEWSNLYAFTGFIKPSGNFTYPLYVFAAGGSPYWRQYISARSAPPSSEYRLDYMFYCSQNPLPGTQQYHVLEAGSLPVIRSYVSKSKNVPGWKDKGLNFYAPKLALAGDKTCKSIQIFLRIQPAIFLFRFDINCSHRKR